MTAYIILELSIKSTPTYLRYETCTCSGPILDAVPTRLIQTTYIRLRRMLWYMKKRYISKQNPIL